MEYNNATDRTRTDTKLIRGILSPVRLPVPPQWHEIMFERRESNDELLSVKPIVCIRAFTF